MLSWAAGAGLVALLDDVIWSHRLVAVLVGAVIGVVMAMVFAAAGWVLKMTEVRWLVGQVQRVVTRLTRRGLNLVTS